MNHLPHSPPSSHLEKEVRRIELAEDVLSAGEARQFVRDTLADWGYSAVEPEATLAVSELVTNAVIHAHSGAAVSLIKLDGAIQMRVADCTPTVPKVVNAGPGDDHGRGMLLVQSVSSDWGVDEYPDGKVVWLDITDH